MMVFKTFYHYSDCLQQSYLRLLVKTDHGQATFSYLLTPTSSNTTRAVLSQFQNESFKIKYVALRYCYLFSQVSFKSFRSSSFGIWGELTMNAETWEELVLTEFSGFVGFLFCFYVSFQMLPLRWTFFFWSVVDLY